MNALRSRLLVASLSLFAAASSPAAQSPLACLIEPERVADVGSPVTGVIDSIRVDRGDTVTAGQPLIVLRSDVERANLQMMETRSRLEADVAAAKANLQLAKQKMTRAERLHEATFISRQALDQTAAEHEVAVQKLAQTKEQMQVVTREVGVAQAQVGLRTIRSPFSGVVIERYMNPGERVEDKPMLKIAMVDPLRVEVLLPTSMYGSVHPGTMLSVKPEVPQVGPVSARVTRVDKVLDPASNTFRVRLALPNPGHKLPAGSRCKIDLPPAGERIGEQQKTKPAMADTSSGKTAAERP